MKIRFFAFKKESEKETNWPDEMLTVILDGKRSIECDLCTRCNSAQVALNRVFKYLKIGGYIEFEKVGAYIKTMVRGGAFNGSAPFKTTSYSGLFWKVEEYGGKWLIYIKLGG